MVEPISWDSIIYTLLPLSERQFPLLSNEGGHNARPACLTGVLVRFRPDRDR